MRGLRTTVASARLHLSQTAAGSSSALWQMHSSSRVAAETQPVESSTSSSILSDVSTALASALPSTSPPSSSSASSSSPSKPSWRYTPRPHGPNDISRASRADLVRFITMASNLPATVTPEQKRQRIRTRAVACSQTRKKLPVYIARKTETSDEAEEMDQVLRACRRLGLVLNRKTADEIMHRLLKTGRPDLVTRFFKDRQTYGLPSDLPLLSIVHWHRGILRLLNKPSAYVPASELELPPLPTEPPFSFKISAELALLRLLILRKLAPPSEPSVAAEATEPEAPADITAAAEASGTADATAGLADNARSGVSKTKVIRPASLLAGVRKQIFGKVEPTASRKPRTEGKVRALLSELRGLGEEWEAVGTLMVKQIAPWLSLPESKGRMRDTLKADVTPGGVESQA